MNYFKGVKNSISIVKETFHSQESGEKIAQSTALGVAFGIMPFPGINTILLAVIALRLKLNMLFIQIINYAFFPVQIILFLPFWRWGAKIFHGKTADISISGLAELLTNDFWNTMEIFGASVLGGLVIWLIVFYPLYTMVYIVVKYSLKQFRAVG